MMQREDFDKSDMRKSKDVERKREDLNRRDIGRREDLNRRDRT